MKNQGEVKLREIRSYRPKDEEQFVFKFKLKAVWSTTTGTKQNHESLLVSYANNSNRQGLSNSRSTSHQTKVLPMKAKMYWKIYLFKFSVSKVRNAVIWHFRTTIVLNGQSISLVICIGFHFTKNRFRTPLVDIFRKANRNKDGTKKGKPPKGQNAWTKIFQKELMMQSGNSCGMAVEDLSES
jgi:hypothetical protein